MSCRQSTLRATNLYCLGEESCFSSPITIAANGVLYCDAYESCRQASISSPGTGATISIYFTGYHSFLKTSVVCKETDICNIFILSDTEGGSIQCQGECNVECANSCPGVVSMDPTAAPSIEPTFSPSTDPTS